MSRSPDFVEDQPGAATLEPCRNELAICADAIETVARQSDAICLKVGGQLCEAVPILSDLSGRFAALSKTLEGGELRDACEVLAVIALDVASIGEGLAKESCFLADTIVTNVALSGLIGNVADDVRFLPAMIMSVKVESASIQDETENLLGFAADLARHAESAQTAISQYRSRHDSLLLQLREAHKLQVAFETARCADLMSAAQGIEDSLAMVTLRRKAIVAAADTVGTSTQRIGSQIGECVVALQVGDSTRQRIEHANHALLLMTGGAKSAEVDLFMAGWAETPASKLAAATGRLCRLQVLQLTDATEEFETEIERIASSLSQLAQGTAGLHATTTELFASSEQRSSSFLGDLEGRLRVASDIIDEYKRARATIDGITDGVVTTFGDLKQLGNSVEAMVTDMTIIGTNAIVKAYRLGQRGAGLSTIAQHLRSRSLRIADGIKILTPALNGALTAATAFATSTESQGVTRVTELGRQMVMVIQSFNLAGTSLAEAIQHLERDSDAVGKMLGIAVVELRETDDIGVRLLETVDRIEVAAGKIGPAEVDRGLDDVIDAHLMRCYTMDSERRVHEAFLA